MNQLYLHTITSSKGRKILNEKMKFHSYRIVLAVRFGPRILQERCPRWALGLGLQTSGPPQASSWRWRALRCGCTNRAWSRFSSSWGLISLNKISNIWSSNRHVRQEKRNQNIQKEWWGPGQGQDSSSAQQPRRGAARYFNLPSF